MNGDRNGVRGFAGSQEHTLQRLSNATLQRADKAFMDGEGIAGVGIAGTLVVGIDLTDNLMVGHFGISCL